MSKDTRDVIEAAVVHAGELFGAYCLGLGLADDRRKYDRKTFEREFRSAFTHRLAALSIPVEDR